MKGTAIYPSPVGDIQLDWEDGAVTALKNADRDAKADAPNELTRLVFRQLDEYFAGTRKTFDFPYRLHGTPFQKAVWAALREIPYASGWMPFSVSQRRRSSVLTPFMRRPSRTSALGSASRSAETDCEIELLPEVQKGRTSLPEKSQLSMKVLMIFGMVPHQMG